jgi:MFS family permease
VNAAVPPSLGLGLARNWRQFAVLILVNAFVGSMVGLERTILPALAEQEFHVAARAAVLSFIVAFGLAKALTNYFAGRISDIVGRKPVLVVGWLIGLPVPFALMWAPSWSWVVLANVLLGVSQGLTWSMTVVMKIDLVGPSRRGLAMGLNEAAGYVAVAITALVTGYVAAQHGLRPWPFALGIAFAAAGLLVSVVVVRETHGYARQEAGSTPETTEPAGSVFARVSLHDRDLSAVSQAGLVNNLNDGMAWGLFPVLFAGTGLGLERVGVLAATYPAVWGLAQLVTGGLSDRVGRKWLIASGMWLQAAAIASVAMSGTFAAFMVAAAALGLGTAMVYPTLLAVIGDVAHASSRASAVGVYRLWRDLGYALGAVVAGVAADLLGLRGSVYLVAALTFVSGVVVALRLRETLRTTDRSPDQTTVARCVA